MKKIVIFAAIAAALVASVSCNKEQSFIPSSGKTITVGFEDRSVDTKTFVKDAAAGTVWWGASEVDTVIYVFDDACKKYAFVSKSRTPEAARSFSCSTWPADAQQGFVVWSGKLETGSNADATAVDGDIISGLTLPSTQYNDHASSFAYNCNVAVMKPGDSKLRSAFGFIRYTVPEKDGYATIKNVKIEADEFLAGPVQIDYSGAEPVTTIVGTGQKVVSADINFNEGYEAGSYFMTVAPGTYHNLKITITPFADNADRSQKNAMAAAPFTLAAKGDVVVERGKYTNAGELPYVDPNEEEEDEDIEWPTDPTAFDYGYTKGVVHEATYPANERNTYDPVIKGGFKLGAATGIYQCTLDRVTYYSVLTFNSNRWTTGGVPGPDTWMDLDGEEYDGIVPQNRCFSWKVNRPGKLKYFMCAENQTSIDRGISYRVVLLKTVAGDTTAEILIDYTPDPTDTEHPIDLTRQPWNHPESYVEFEVPKEALLGIDEAATLYFYAYCKSKMNLTIHHFPILWTPTAKEKLD